MKLIEKFKNSSKDDKNIIINVAGAFFIKGLSLIISLLLTPAYIKFFNDEVALGLWFTVNSVLAWILNFDLGIGNGLRNHLTRTYTEGNLEESKKYLSSAYISVGFVCLVVSIIFMSSFKFINWNMVFNIEKDIVSTNALFIAVLIVFIGILMQLFLKLINSVLYAIQKSSINNFLTFSTSIITLICVLLIPSRDNDTNLINMAFIHIAAVNVPLIIATIIIFTKTSLKRCLPSIKLFSKKHAKEVLSLGGIFLFVQIEYMVIMSTNEILITWFASNEAVVEYQLYYKPFSMVGTLFALALTPIWSAVTKAFTEKNFKWISNLYKKLFILSIIGTVACFVVIPILQIFMDIWLGRGYLDVNYIYAIAFSLLSGLMMINSVLSSFANGMGELKTQAIFFGIGSIVKIPIAYIFVVLFKSWIGVVWANIIALGLYCIVQPFVFKKNLNKKIEENYN